MLSEKFLISHLSLPMIIWSPFTTNCLFFFCFCLYKCEDSFSRCVSLSSLWPLRDCLSGFGIVSLSACLSCRYSMLPETIGQLFVGGMDQPFSCMKVTALWWVVILSTGSTVICSVILNSLCTDSTVVVLTLWRPLLPCGYSYRASRARPG